MTERRFPRWSELAPLLHPRPFEPSPTRRRLAAAYTVGDLRAIARRRTPRAIFDYVDGGAEHEITLRRARQLFRRLEFQPSILRDVSVVDLSTTLLGRPVAAPYVFSPTGVTRLMHHTGEIAVSRSAARFGVPYTLSTVGTTSPEDLATAVPHGRNWFGFHVWKDRGASLELLERADAAGYEALVVVVDAPVPGARLRDSHHGFTIPPRITPKTVLDGALHPSWWFNFLTTEPLSFPSLTGPGGSVEQLSTRLADPRVTIEDLEWIRSKWAGPVVVKGIGTVADARRVVDVGADAIVLSTHGGRQLDQAPLPLRVLPDAVVAVGNRAEIYLDTGVTCGADVVAALALGARAVFLGRAYLYGLMAGGEAGVDRVHQILVAEIRRTLQLLGVRSVGELTAAHVRLP